MNLKTPLFLILIIGPILAIILVVWPDIQKIGPKKAELKANEELVASIRQKNENIAALSRILADPQNSGRKEFVMQYIPADKKEERIFNAINSIAGAEGVKVALSNVSLKVGKEETASVVEVPADVPGMLGGTEGIAMIGDGQASILPATKTITADVSTVGSYESQKNFIAKLYALDMMKRISGFTLTSSAGSEGGSADVLTGTLNIEFSFIPEAKVGKNYNSPIFDQSGFDFGPVEKMTALLYEKAAVVTVGGAGRSNPFLP